MGSSSLLALLALCSLAHASALGGGGQFVPLAPARAEHARGSAFAAPPLTGGRVLPSQGGNAGHGCAFPARRPLLLLARRGLRGGSAVPHAQGAISLRAQQESGRLPSNGEGSRPLVVILGFLGSTPRILRKYQDLYEEQGVQAKAVIPSFKSMFLGHLGMRGRGSKQVRSVCSMLEEEAAQGRNMVLHVMSNNGFIFLAACLLHTAALSTIFSAVVFDSCPCRITPEVAATGVAAAAQKADAKEVAGGIVEKGLRVGMAAWLKALQERQDRLWDTWRERFVVAPALFLYSDEDAVVPPAKVQEFAKGHAALLREEGLACKIRAWPKGMHCEMLRDYPDEYRGEVRAFLSEALGPKPA